MTTIFDELRAKEKSKLDEALKAARAEYRRAIREINAVELKALGKTAKTVKVPVMLCVSQCIRPNEPFTIGSIFDAMNSKYPEHRRTRDHVKCCLTRLKRRGLIHLVGRDEAGSPVYVVSTNWNTPIR